MKLDSNLILPSLCGLEEVTCSNLIFHMCKAIVAKVLNPLLLKGSMILQ